MEEILIIPGGEPFLCQSLIHLTCHRPRSRFIVVPSDCAVCDTGYGRGIAHTCHYCDNTMARMLVAMGTLFFLVGFLVLVLAVIFLIGGLDAIGVVRQSVGRTLTVGNKSPGRARPIPVTCMSEPPYNAADDFDLTYGGCPASGTASTYRRPKDSAIAGRSANGEQANKSVDADAGSGGRSGSGWVGDTVKSWVSRLPLDKLKIIVVVWQILTGFSNITGVEYPDSYSTFLSWLNVVNLDLGSIVSASCVLPSANFYLSLLLTTLTPLGLAALLVLTFHMAKHRAGIGSAGAIARRAAWSRHVAAGLLLTFLVSL